MNHRKRKKLENSKKPKKQIYDPYLDDPSEAECPYCGKKGKICSHINGLSRAWARDACKKKTMFYNKSED